jgi:hypothetical protein
MTRPDLTWPVVHFSPGHYFVDISADFGLRLLLTCYLPALIQACPGLAGLAWPD